MSAFKQFTTKDVAITPFDAIKGFSFSGNEITGSTVGIEVYQGIKPTSSVFISQSEQPTGLVFIQNTTVIYSSIKQLYYSNYLTSSLGDTVPTRSIIAGATPEDLRYVGAIEAPRYENYLQSTLTQSRYFPTGSGDKISVVSVPAKLFGENIVPYTFEVEYTNSLGLAAKVIDDGEGNLKVLSTSGSIAAYGAGAYGAGSYGSLTGLNSGSIVGQVFYSHGIATFTTSSLITMGGEVSESVANLANFTVNFSSSFRLYEHQYKCGIRNNEFDFSLNPTLLSGSADDVYYDFATGSEFNPYVTTIGLYDENNQLLVVGKLSFPVPISRYVDTTLIVNFDT